MSHPTRRGVLAGAAGLSAATLLAACGSNEQAAPTPTPAAAAPPRAKPPLGKTSDIPVSGGKIFADQGVVVTQPAAGEFKAFSSLCTHKGCLLTSVENDVILCKCHNSMFAAKDGSVRSGPATLPLPPMNITVDGDTIRLA